MSRSTMTPDRRNLLLRNLLESRLPCGCEYVGSERSVVCVEHDRPAPAEVDPELAARHDRDERTERRLDNLEARCDALAERLDKLEAARSADS